MPQYTVAEIVKRNSIQIKEVKFIHVRETKKLEKIILILPKNLTRLVEEGESPFSKHINGLERKKYRHGSRRVSKVRMALLMKTCNTLLTCPLDGAHSSLMQKINKLLFDS
jgi:hypothetical protein